jgi:hypothetical protein
VSYHRLARQVDTTDGPARLTLDSGLQVVDDAFGAALGDTEGSLQSFVERRQRFLPNVTDAERRLP